MSKGGSTTQSVEIPEYIEAAAQRNLNKAERISQLGYVPYYGPDVAAFTPMQQAGFQNTADVAGAFGMAAPTTQQDIMGGINAPTQYAGGVQGYSSQPIFQQSLDKFRQQRPGQAEYMDSFFVDPTTGAAGSNAPTMIDYTQYNTMAENARQAAAAGGGVDASALGPDTGRYSGGGGNGRGVFDMYEGPNLDGSAGYGPGGYTSFGDMFDGGGPGVKGGAFSGGGAISDVANAATGGDGPGGDKVICTALHNMGLLPDDIYALDAAFGQRVNKEDPALGDGYRLWATPVANYIEGDGFGSKVVRSLIAPVAKAWAAQMAHVMRPDEYRQSIAGKFLMAVGHPICRTIGQLAAARPQEKDA